MGNEYSLRVRVIKFQNKGCEWVLEYSKTFEYASNFEYLDKIKLKQFVFNYKNKMVYVT